MTTYPTYPVPGPGYYDDTYYHSNFYSSNPAPGYHYEFQYTTSYGPPPETPYAYHYPQPPPPRPATSFQSKRPQSSYQHEQYGRDREGREAYEEDLYTGEDMREEDGKTRFSPRYHSSGIYATASMKPCRKDCRSGPRRMRSFSTSHPIPGIDSDDESRLDEFVKNDSAETNFHYDRKAPRRPKKQSYNYRGQGRTRTHTNEERLEEEEEEEEQPQQDRIPRQRTRSSKYNARASSAAPRRSHGARPATPRQERRHAPATDEDRRKHQFPPHYFLEFWDPAESPIILLGNVFDANSLGKWIYDWTSYCYTTSSPIAEVAGELWCLLIVLAGKIKRAEECISLTRSDEAKDLLQDFITSGERLHVRLQEILELCEKPMLSVSESKGKTQRLSMDSGIMFVETIFGRDSLLLMTEKFMHSIRIWNLRFDANCGDICGRKKKY